jgi:hypothetical protein
MENQNVSLTISKEIVQPIVKAKIQEALIGALGGTEKLIETVTESIFNTKVNHEGKTSGYSSENKYNWLDIIVTNQIKVAVQEVVKEILETRQTEIKAAISKQLSIKKGIEAFAQALLSGTADASKTYRQSIEVKFEPVNRY